MSSFDALPISMGVFGLMVALVIYFLMVRYSEGGEKIKKIADSIHEGAMVFMHREYFMLALFAVPLFFVILFSPLGFNTACLLYTSPSPRDATLSRMPSSA